MQRTQLYLDEDLLGMLRIRSRQSGTSVSELVRRAVREKYAGRHRSREQAMQAFAGIWKDRAGLGNTEKYLRRLREGTRLKRLR